LQLLKTCIAKLVNKDSDYSLFLKSSHMTAVEAKVVLVYQLLEAFAINPSGFAYS